MTGKFSRLTGLGMALAILAAAAAVAATPPPAKPSKPSTAHKSSSQQKATTTTYRWVDKDGVVHFGDQVPPEYASTTRQVLNAFGIPVASQDGAKTAEQIAADKAAAKKAAEERQKVILAARRDQVLLDTYLSVDEIEALRDRRLELIDTQIKVTENYLEGLRDILSKQQAEASTFKPYSSDPKAPPIDERLAKELSNTMDSIQLYEKNLVETKKRKTGVVDQFANDIDRFKELKAAAPVE